MYKEINNAFLLTQEELNEISKLITNTNIIAQRAIKDGYMNKEEIEQTNTNCKMRREILAKLIGQSI